MSGLIFSAPLIPVITRVRQFLDNHHPGFDVLIRGLCLHLAVTVLDERVMRLHAFVLLWSRVPLCRPLIAAVVFKNRIVVYALVISLALHNGHWLVPLPLNVPSVVVSLRPEVLIVSLRA